MHQAGLPFALREKPHRLTFPQFGAGYNVCPGRHLAHLEISKLCATLARDYDMELVDPNKPWEHSNHFLIVPHGWPVYLKKRDLSTISSAAEGADGAH